MKKFIYQITLMLAMVLGFTACDDKNDSDYVPGEPTPENSMQVYFDAANASDFIVAPENTSVDITVSRGNTTEAAEVPIICKQKADELTIPSSVKFEAGQKTATLTIELGQLEENKQYNFSLAIDEAYADHYAKLDGATSYSGYVVETTWKTYINNVKMTWTVGGVQQTWNTEIERLGTLNRYRIRNFVDSGLDFTFTIGGVADTGTSGDYKMEPYDNYYNDNDGTADCFYLYDSAKGEYPNWTLGNKTISYLCIMRSYTGAGDYTYISLSTGYGMIGTYYVDYTDGTSDSYNYIELYFNPVKE